MPRTATRDQVFLGTVRVILRQSLILAHQSPRQLQIALDLPFHLLVILVIAQNRLLHTREAPLRHLAHRLAHNLTIHLRIPRVRSGNTIGTSTTQPPAAITRRVISIWNT